MKIFGCVINEFVFWSLDYYMMHLYIILFRLISFFPLEIYLVYHAIDRESEAKSEKNCRVKSCVVFA